jgi:hypothetical protein
VEASPLESLQVSGRAGELKVQFKTRTVAPAYVLRGYTLRAVVDGSGAIPVERIETRLPELEPGDETSVTVRFTEPRPVQVKLDLLRPTGSSAHTAIWKPAI